jgi:hypothetical protein
VKYLKELFAKVPGRLHFGAKDLLEKQEGKYSNRRRL